MVAFQIYLCQEAVQSCAKYLISLCLSCLRYNMEIIIFTVYTMGFSIDPAGTEAARQCRRCKRHGFNPWVQKIPWRMKWQLTSVFLLGKVYGQRRLVGYSPRVTKSQTWLSAHAHIICVCTLSSLSLYIYIYMAYIIWHCTTIQYYISYCYFSVLRTTKGFQLALLVR